MSHCSSCLVAPSAGLGLAWAVASRLAKSVACRCLMATHFHELTMLEREATPTCPITNQHFTATTHQGRLILRYQISQGPCDQSFGVHVAKLANFPPSIIQAAQGRVDALLKGQSRLLSWELPPMPPEIIDTMPGAHARRPSLNPEEEKEETQEEEGKEEVEGAEEEHDKLFHTLAAVPWDEFPVDDALKTLGELLQRG